MARYSIRNYQCRQPSPWLVENISETSQAEKTRTQPFVGNFINSVEPLIQFRRMTGCFPAVRNGDKMNPKTSFNPVDFSFFVFYEVYFSLAKPTHPPPSWFTECSQLQELRLKTINEELKMEINMFLSTITEYHGVISLGGYLTMNRQLLTSLFGMIVSNVVILLQVRGQYLASRPGHSQQQTNQSVQEETFTG
ncbi:unnamed protein product [Timema podura]|uniref:Uncharacterized protein n=1 Tax=Timema podura TaxID=61482 RepID=A0ABN7NJD6_TIMPD|nr:unnamed protein product [Timema podura]